MADYRVLLTTSGVGSRLGELTNYTNKSLVRINNKPTISHIIEKYDDGVEFVVTLGYFGTQVQEFLELAYPNRKFTFVSVDNYDGDASSLGYSMLNAKKELNCPFIFHACDTIIERSNLLSDMFVINRQNFVLGNTKTSFDQYRTIQSKLTEHTHTLSRFREKGEVNGAEALAYIGVCGIYEHEKFWNKLESLYMENPKYTGLSDCHVINLMVRDGSEFWVEKVDKWYDIGNTTSLKETRKALSTGFEILDKVDESVFMFNDSVIKFFYDETIVKDRVARVSLVPGTPDIIGYGKNFFKYNRAVGNTFARSVTEKKFGKFLDWMGNNVWIPISTYGFRNDCYEFYYNKTKQRIQKYIENTHQLPNDKTINGTYCLSVGTILNEIDSEWLTDGIACNFHGDCILDNVIELHGTFTLIDWRQNFNGKLYGDVYYDLAKLNHNLTFNHDLVNAGHYKCEVENESWVVDILISNKLQACRETLHKFVVDNGYDLNKVELLTAIIWINMAPLHSGKLGDFLMVFGQWHLNRIYTRIKNEQNIKKSSRVNQN